MEALDSGVQQNHVRSDEKDSVYLIDPTNLQGRIVTRGVFFWRRLSILLAYEYLHCGIRKSYYSIHVGLNIDFAPASCQILSVSYIFNIVAGTLFYFLSTQ